MLDLHILLIRVIGRILGIAFFSRLFPFRSDTRSDSRCDTLLRYSDTNLCPFKHFYEHYIFHSCIVPVVCIYLHSAL